MPTTEKTNLTARKLPGDQKIGRQFRAMHFERSAVDVEARTVSLSFSSEAAVVRRWWGNEILGHEPGEVVTDWMESGRAPLLMDHNPRDQVGVVTEVVIGSDRVGRAVVRFGNSARAEEIFKDVQDGVRSNVSVGYDVEEILLISEKDDEATYRATKWRPYEISFVAMPADTNVGVGRNESSIDVQPVQIKAKDAPAMETQTQVPPAAIAAAAASTVAITQVRKDYAAEALEITSIAEQLKMPDLAKRAFSENMGIEQFRKLILDEQLKRNVQNATPTTAPAQIGLDTKEVKSYSLVRAINAAATNDWSQAGFERECSRAVEKQTGEAARGFFVPYDLLVDPNFLSGKRDNVVGTASAGGNLVATNLLAGSFIETLRNRSSVTALGAQLLPGLVGNVDIPRQITSATAGWVGEQAEQAKSNATFDKVQLAIKTISAQTQISRSMLKQSTPAIDALVRNDLTKIVALGIDNAALNGSGSSNQPRGIRNLSGITVVALGTNGGTIAWANLVQLETNVATANADEGSLAYLTNPSQRGKMKGIVKFASTASPLWEEVAGAPPGEGMINGYRARVSNQVPANLTKGSATSVCSNITYGNWSELLIGMWGTLDLQVDPFTAGNYGDTIVRVFQSVDIAARHTTSFNIIEDAL